MLKEIRKKRLFKKIIKNKSGVSLMISYVILISIAVGISIGIFAWLKVFSGDVKPKINCDENTFITLTNYRIEDDELFLNIKNNGRFNVSGFILSVANDTEKKPAIYLKEKGSPYGGHYYFIKPLRPGERKEVIFTTETKEGGEFDLLELKVIQIQPFIIVDLDTIVCDDAVIKEII